MRLYILKGGFEGGSLQPVGSQEPQGCWPARQCRYIINHACSAGGTPFVTLPVSAALSMHHRDIPGTQARHSSIRRRNACSRQLEMRCEEAVMRVDRAPLVLKQIARTGRRLQFVCFRSAREIGT